jgi:hypothetical protein
MARHREVPLDELDKWQKFARTLYNSWDADPGYYAIQHTRMPQAQRKRLAVAWCTYYNLGIAADASGHNGKRFWNYLDSIYDTAKRNTERRHFRGNAGRVALDFWREYWPLPEDMADHICEGAETYFDIRTRCRNIPQLGDYFIWKWCDLSEVLGYGSLDMSNSAKHSPKLPQQGALLIDMMAGVPIGGLSDRETVERVYAEIADYGRVKGIPPRTTDQRGFGVQEAETVCCVYKQMASGSYIYGSRTAKAVARLGSAKSDTAHAMRETLLKLSPYSAPELAKVLKKLTGKE